MTSVSPRQALNVCIGVKRRRAQTEQIAYVTEFVEEAKASGLVQKAIERGGTRGVTVAAPGNSN
jgi:hypothetical protein